MPTVLGKRSASTLRFIGVDLAVTLSSALLLWFAFAPIGQFYLAWVGLVPLLWRVMSVERMHRAAGIGYLFGLAYFAFGYHWLFNATPPGYVVVCLMMSLYPMLACIVIHRARRSGPILLAIVSATAWTATEYLRGIVLGGFPWLQIGHTQSPLLTLCQIADITGVAGVSAWVVLVNASITRVLQTVSRSRRPAPSPGTPGEGWGEGSGMFQIGSKPASTHPLTLTLSPEYGGEGTRDAGRLIGLVTVITLLLLSYGWLRISLYHDSPPEIRIALVQSNFVHARGGAKTVTQQQQIDYLLEKSKSIENVDLIAWPETMMPPLNVEARTEPGLGGAAFFNRTLDQVASLAQDRNASILTGGYFVGGFKGEIGKRKATDIRNSVYHLSSDGALAGRYDKIHLVPFAEWLPFQESSNAFHRFMTRFATAAYAGGYHLTPGQERTVFTLPPDGYQERIITPICFEDTIAPLVRSFIKPEAGATRKRADLILNISNDGWFNRFEQSLHLQIAVFRSIENRVPTARVSNTGQSAFIDSNGRITSSLPAFEEGILRGICRLDGRISVYTRFGDLFAWGCIVLTGVCLAFSFRTRKGLAPGALR